MNDEHYDNRANTIRIEIETRQEQRRSLDREKSEVKEKLEEALSQDNSARQGLIDVQSRIAEHTALIEEKKKEIMDLLGSRASTQAKIQHYDTTKDQITVRKAELSRGMLEVSEEGERLGQRLKEYEEELEKVQETIRGYNSQIAENEKRIEQFQRELNEQQEKLRIGQTAYHRESSRLESLKNITERYDGYGNSIRKVMEQKKQDIINEGNWDQVLSCFNEALDRICEYRAAEGKSLYADVTAKVKNILDFIPQIETYEKERVTAVKERLTGRLAELNAAADQNRLEQEMQVLKEDFIVLEQFYPNAQIDSQQICLSLNTNTLTVNGIEKSVRVSPYVSENGYVMLPLRELATALPNLEVAWDKERNTACLYTADRWHDLLAEIPLGSQTASFHGQTLALREPATEKDGRTFLSLRDAANICGIRNSEITWDAETQTVRIDKDFITYT